jgi:hypothetical protein
MRSACGKSRGSGVMVSSDHYMPHEGQTSRNILTSFTICRFISTCPLFGEVTSAVVQFHGDSDYVAVLGNSSVVFTLWNIQRYQESCCNEEAGVKYRRTTELDRKLSKQKQKTNSVVWVRGSYERNMQRIILKASHVNFRCTYFRLKMVVRPKHVANNFKSQSR